MSSSNSPSERPEFLIPTGVVTLMLGDVEGSTRHWEEDPKMMTLAMSKLSKIVGESVGRHNGVRPLEQGEGDSFVAAFSRPTDAVASAIDIQKQLLDTPVRIRIGVHTGEVSLRGAENYAGSTVNRAARLRDAGHGGQIVVSAATHDLVLDRPPEAVTFLDLGTHHLRDLARPEHIFQLVHPDLPEEFPSLRSLGTFRTNLPVQLTTFVGRELEINEVRSLFTKTRFVTLVGTGGCGKTRLALQVAAEMLDEHPGGTWFIDLSTVNDDGDVAAAVGDVLQTPDAPMGDPVHRIAEPIGNKATLLMLDNCEHLPQGCAALASGLLQASTGIRILATSREPLRAEGESIWRVPSLGLPIHDEPLRIEGVAACEAVQLFVQRAHRARHNFQLTEQNLQSVMRICERLDGIPLALELAAAQVRALTPDQIVDALDDRFRLLTGGARTLVPRQQTLQASVDWSHELLSSEERMLFRRLAVMSGDFSLEAAETVCSGDELPSNQVLSVLIRLVDRSLVVMDDTGTEPRYRMLETVRSYAREKLEEAKELNHFSGHHRDHFLSLGEELASSSDPKQQSSALTLVHQDHANFLAALEWSRERGDAAELGKLVHSLVGYWYMHGPRSVGREWVKEALEMRNALDPATVTRLLSDAVRMGFNPTEDLSLGEEAVRLAQELGDTELLSSALTALGEAKIWVAGGAEGLEHLKEGLALAREAGSGPHLLPLLQRIGRVEIWLGRFDAASERADEVLAISKKVGNNDGTASGLSMSATCDFVTGHLNKAKEDLRTAIGLVDPTNLALRFELLSSLARLHQLSGFYEEARELVREASELEVQLNGTSTQLTSFEAYMSHMEGKATEEQYAILQSPSSGWNAIEVSLDIGDLERARESLNTMLGRVNQTRHAIVLGFASALRARLAILQGRFADAEDLAHQALEIVRGMGKWVELPEIFELMAEIAISQEDALKTARLLGAAEAHRTTMGLAATPKERERSGAVRVRAMDFLGEAAFAAGWHEGAAMTSEELIAYVQRGRGSRKRSSHGWDSLTPTELTVAERIAEGLSNAEIASKMFISVGTVRAHLTHIFSKLGISSRTQLATEFTRRAAVSERV